MKQLVNLLRIRQYYKNLLIFLPIVFAQKFFDFNALWLTVLGFIALCLISSTNYIINDILDVKKDRLHPEKRHRPIASGKIKIWQAIIIALILLFISVVLAAYLAMNFLYAVLFLLIFTLIYSLLLKKAVFVDILSISILLVVRAMSGAFIIDVVISQWLIFCIFFLALFLAIGKREADIKLLGKNAVKTRKVLEYYTPEITNALMVVSTTALILSYSLYAFFSQYKNLIYTIPFALYVIFRYFYFVYSGDKIARHPERALLDWKIVFGIVLWALAAFIIIYL